MIKLVRRTIFDMKCRSEVQKSMFHMYYVYTCVKPHIMAKDEILHTLMPMHKLMLCLRIQSIVFHLTLISLTFHLYNY